MLLACNESSSEKKSAKEKRKELIEIKRYDFKPYKPEQPIKFNHKTHVGVGIACSHCHTNYTEKDTVMGEN